MVRTSDLRVKEVINLLDGRRLGVIGDLEVDMESGRVDALIVLGQGRFLGIFGRDRDLVIPFGRVHKIGVDVILVDLDGLAGSEG